MKKILIIPALIFAFTFISCKKDSPASNENDNSKPINKELTAKAAGFFSGCLPWRIEQFIQKGANETDRYNGYTFSFCPDNTVTVANDILPFDGQWWILLAGGGPTSYFELDFKLNDQTARAAELEGMWELTGMDSNKITLDSQDKTVRLVFTRIY